MTELSYIAAVLGRLREIASALDSVRQDLVAVRSVVEPSISEVSVSAADNTSGVYIDVDTLGRRFVIAVAEVGSDAGAEIEVLMSNDGAVYRALMRRSFRGVAVEQVPAVARFLRIGVPTTGVSVRLRVVA